MPLVLYNTITRCKEPFEPLIPGKVKVYACGPTVYDYFHIGNARAFVVADTLRRVLTHLGYRVTFVQNITDVDDKIIQRGLREGRPAAAVAEEFTRAFVQDLAALGCTPADQTPRATAHLPEIIALIQRILEARHAYVLEGDVYFSVRSLPEYGEISGKRIEELESGARIEVDRRKQDPLDFALWKAAKPGEPSWDSPWGPGRPGWHIECSAMSMKYLGEQFDIHAGGEDLIFPHHENENAQSRSVTGKRLARYWLHNGYLRIDGEKMSKSLGNFRTLRELLPSIPAPVLRVLLLSANYRSPLDFNPENLLAARHGYGELKRTLERLDQIARLHLSNPGAEDPAPERLEQEQIAVQERFEQALQDDLNTADALGQCFSLANRTRQLLAQRSLEPSARWQTVLRAVSMSVQAMLAVLGIQPEVASVPPAIVDLMQQRQQARQERIWTEADRLRSEAGSLGYELEDTGFGMLAVSMLDPTIGPVV